MAPRGVWTAEKGEQETQILFLKKINAEPPPNSLQVRRGIHRCPVINPREWAGCTHMRTSTRVQTHVPDARIPGARKQPLWHAHPGARARLSLTRAPLCAHA